MLASKYSGSDRLEPTAENFPALQNFWDKNHVDGAYLRDTVGTQDVWGDHGQWFVDETGFSKWSISGGNYTKDYFEAPGARAIVLLTSGLVSAKWRPMSIGAGMTPGEHATLPEGFTERPPGSPQPPGVSTDFSAAAQWALYVDENNYAEPPLFSFTELLSQTQPSIGENMYPDPSNPGIRGCAATVIDFARSSATVHWAGRVGNTASYDPIYEAHEAVWVGTMPETLGAMGNGLSTHPSNRFEWSALMYFDSGAPLDIEEAMRWMAQHDDFRLYPGWKGKQ